MQRTMVEEFTSTPEGMAEFQQERVILEIAMLIRRLLKEKGLTKVELADRLGRSKAFVTQLLNGRANMTLRTISDVLCALGHSLTVAAGPLQVRAMDAETITARWSLDSQPATVLFQATSDIPVAEAPVRVPGTIDTPPPTPRSLSV